MFDLIDVMQWTGVSTLAVVVFVLIFNVKSNIKQSGPFSVPNWNFHLKKFWARRLLRKKSATDEEKAVDFQNFESEQLIGDNLLHSSQFFYGADTEGNALIINLAIGKDGYAEIWMHLRLADGGMYALPSHPSVHSTRIGPINEGKFEIAGLNVQCLQPYLRWRLAFAGLLRKIGDCDSDELHFIKFNFIWTMCGTPQHWPEDWSNELKATALASEPWRHGFWLDYLSTNGYGGFDQFGALFGQVHVTGTSFNASETQTVELNLPGVRQRRWTSYDQEKVRRVCSIVGVCADGSVYILGAHSLERNLTNAQFGHVRMSNGFVAAIDSTDFHLANFAENPAHIPSVANLSFTAFGRTFSTTVYVRSGDRIELSGSVPQPWLENVLGADIGLNGEYGKGIVRLWYANNATYNATTSATTATATSAIPRARLSKRASYAQLMGSTQRPTRTKIAYWFTDAGAQSEAIAGGKGASLALLTAAMAIPAEEEDAHHAPIDFNVPFGFVLSVSAYDLQLSMHPEIADAVEQIKSIAYHKLDGDLKAACHRCVSIIETAALEPEIEQIIAKYVRDLNARLGASSVRFAVRSSAIGEDGADASSAGQNETFLGLRSVDEVWTAVKRCWASLYAHRSVEYRRQHMLPIDTQMAVVVQQMVAADVAGVLFTCDPHSGDPRKMLVTSNYGLGESVVSGQVEPDTFVVAKHSAADFRVIETQLGTKAHSIRMAADDGDTVIVSAEQSSSDQLESSLTVEEIVQLARIGDRLEKLFGNARDIEWALFEHKFYILQSRPITTSNVMSNWELLHELDTAVMSKEDLFSFANVGEVMPGCVTPLTSSTIVNLLQQSTIKAVNQAQRRYRCRFESSYSRTHHRLSLDVYQIFLPVRDQHISLTDQIQSIAVSGCEYITPHIHHISLQRNGVLPGREKLASLLTVIKCCWLNGAVVDRLAGFMDMYRGRFSDENLRKHFADYDAKQFAAEIEFELLDPDRLEEAFSNHTHATVVSTFSQLFAGVVMAEGATELGAEHFRDIATMLGSCNGAESAEVPTMLEEIANAIYIAGKTDEFLQVAPSEGVEWLARNCGAASRMYRNFVSRHGHRAFKEFELMAIPWVQRPDFVIEMIQANSRIANNTAIHKTKRASNSNEDIIRQLRTPTRWLTRHILGYMLTLCQRSVQRRESTKSLCIAYVNELRKAYRHLAQLLVHDGLLPEPELIFFLTHAELGQLMRRTATIVGYAPSKAAIVTKAQRRQRLFPAWEQLRFDQLNAYITKPVNREEHSGAAESSAGGVAIRGTPVCEGIVTGRACVIGNFADVDQIQAGDILVTHGTDIAWSPYFPMLGGVVTELGGLISHGAVVAREYGLPCIVAAAGATQRLRNGERVTLNATKGLIYPAVEGVVGGEDESEA